MNIIEHYNFESEFYEKLYGDYSDDVFTIKSLLPRGKILEIFCGTGRIISNFKNGIGIDNNRNMLIRSERTFVKIQADAFFLPFKQVFNFVILGLNSLLLFKDNDKIRILREVERITLRGGRIFIDIINGFSLKEEEYTISTYRKGKEYIKVQMKPERFEDKYILHYRYIINSNGIHSVNKDLEIYPVDFERIKSILEMTGFAIKNVWGEYDLSPYSKNSDKMIIDAIKKD